MSKSLIKASFFVDGDTFQRVSQWESSLNDFYAAHGMVMDRITVVGAGDGELFYILRKIESPAIVEPKQTNGLTKKMMDVKSKENPGLKKGGKPLVNVKEVNRSKRTFDAGKLQFGKVGKLTMAKIPPQGT